MSKPFFSILILFWQSEQYLQRCLQSLLEQTYQDFEVILLNNGASQPPDPEVLSNFRDLEIKQIHSDINLGFAGGNNLAAKSAAGEYLILLNGDAFPEPSWLATLHQAAQTHPGHCFASRLLQADNSALLDGEWNVYHASGLAWRKNHNQPAARSATSPQLVMSACAAASAYPRMAFEQAGGLMRISSLTWKTLTLICACSWLGILFSTCRKPLSGISALAAPATAVTLPPITGSAT